MNTLAVILALVLVSFAAIHAACAAAGLRWKKHTTLDATFRPKVAVILPVRGADPSLRDTIIHLMQQEYEPFEVHIVVDHSLDSAWPLVDEIVRDHDHGRRCHVQTLEKIPRCCGLKCAAIVQAVRKLRDVNVVATIDADIVPHSTWLRELTAPLADPKVGAATGNHWFEPKGTNCGSLVRSLWNAGALIPTAFFANPWGGSCALWLADIHQSGLLEAWEKSAVDDGPIREACSRLNGRIAFVPRLIMINRENCSLGFCVRYMTRILTWSRLYEPAFRWTVAHLIVNFVPLILALVLMIVSLVRLNATASAILAFGIIAHSIFMWSAFLLVRASVARMAATRSDMLTFLGGWRMVKLLAFTPVALGVYAWSMIRAASSRFVCWRKVWYYLGPDSQVVLITYQPHSATDESANPESSI